MRRRSPVARGWLAPLGLALALCLAGASPSGKQLPVRLFTTTDGLPLDHMACVYGDPRGFVWFCTSEGLARFDGQTTVTFGREDGLEVPGIRAFLHARSGRSWTGTDDGLFEFLPGATDRAKRFQRVATDDGRPTRAINAIAEAPDGSLWSAGGVGLFRLAPGTDRLVEVDISLARGSENDQIVRGVLVEKDGTVWAGAGSGIYRRRPDGHVRRITVANGLPVNEVWMLAVDAADRLWAATREGLVLIDRSAVERGDTRVVTRVYTVDDGLTATNVKMLRADRGALWVGTVRGLSEITLMPSGDLSIGRELIGFYSWGLDTDVRGDVWVATEAGARRLTQQGFTTYRREDGLASNRVSSFFTSRRGELCAVTLPFSFKLACFDGTQFQPKRVRAVEGIKDPGWGWSQLTVQDRRGRWWIPTGEGLFEFAAGDIDRLATATPVAVYDVGDGLRSNNIFRVFEDSRGAIWIATFADEGNGLARIDPDTRQVTAFGPADGLPVQLPIVHSFAEDRAGHVWVGLEHGTLLRFRDGRFEHIPLDTSGDARPTAEHLRALLVDRQGRLWIASGVAGLGRIDTPTGAHPAVSWLGMAQGLSSNTTWMLLEHPSGDVLVGTGRGIDRVSPASGRVTHWGTDEGVPRGEVWGATLDRSGDIWFATTDGAARRGVEEDSPAPLPETFVTAVRVGGNAWPVSAEGAARVERVMLEPGDRRLEIEFVSPVARRSDGLRYEYQLEGVDTEWTPTDARSVAFAGIAPGDYLFSVRARLGNGDVGAPATVGFSVRAPVWRRAWFLALVAAGVFGLIWAFHQARVARLLEVERVRLRIAADLHDGVGGSLSRIAILSEVARRQAEAGLPTAMPALASIGDSARELIDDMSDAVWFIDPKVDNLQQIVVRVRSLAAELFDERHIAWTLEVPSTAANVALKSEHRRHLYLMLKESLTNIVRHAHAARVSVRIEIEAGLLRVDVIDDGVGFDAATVPEAGGAHGVANLRMRAKALGGRLEFGTGESGKGTRITFDVPRGPA
ncbi:MAG: two-component regulator propeller domain-containing protein [Vicinamibacterales bacterium]